MVAAFTRLDLENKIKEIYGIDQITHLIDTQITRYVREKQWSYRDIAFALIYFYVVKKGDLTQAKGIGIVPFVIDEALVWAKNEAKRIHDQTLSSEEYKNKGLSYDINCKKTIRRKKTKRPRIDISSIREDNNG